MDSAGSSEPRKLVLDPHGSVGAAVIDALQFGADALERERPAAAAGESEPIHQLRVASRRLRAALEMFAPILHAAQIEMLRRDLPWIAQMAGKVRECDVIAVSIRERASKLEPRLAAMLAPLYSELKVTRRLALADLGQAFDSPRYAATLARLRKPRVRVAAANAILASAAGSILARVARTMWRAGAELTATPPSDLVHRLRVRVKRLRYALEMLAAAGRKRHRKAIARLADLQDLLGSLNDTTVAIRWLITYAGADGAPAEAVLAAGAMSQSLKRRERKLGRRCVKAWRKLERGETIQSAIEAIRRRGATPHHAAARAKVSIPGAR